MNTSTYRLAIDGDNLEKHYWGQFIQDQFPSYEVFWLKFIVPLTNRPTDIHFKNNSELSKIEKSESDVCIAQLNYSILRHLIRCFEIRKAINTSHWVNQFDLILEGMTSLVSCHDIAFELLDRLVNPSNYKAFDMKSSKKAKIKRQDSNNNTALNLIRKYRDNLVHGRLPPSIIGERGLCLPAIGKESEYLDWRKTTDFNNPKREKYKKDFPYASEIFECVWNETIIYLENSWKNL